jgi:hypothetical protein
MLFYFGRSVLDDDQRAHSERTTRRRRRTVVFRRSTETTDVLILWRVILPWGGLTQFPERTQKPLRHKEFRLIDERESRFYGARDSFFLPWAETR